MQAPSDTNRVNITQLQAMSNTFLSCGLSPTRTRGAPLPQWQCRDRLCLYSDPTSSAGPPSLTHEWQPELAAEVRHDKSPCYITVPHIARGGLISCHCWKLEQDVFADIYFRCQGKQIDLIAKILGVVGCCTCKAIHWHFGKFLSWVSGLMGIRICPKVTNSPSNIWLEIVVS